MFWFYPGVKIYPTGSDGIVRYAVGPSLAFGTGSRNYGRNIYDPGTGTYQYKRIEDDIFVMGIVVNNSLNIQPTPRLHLGLELGLGIPYYSTEPRDLNYDPYNELYNAPLVQFNFHVGYRF